MLVLVVLVAQSLAVRLMPERLQLCNKVMVTMVMMMMMTVGRVAWVMMTMMRWQS